MANPDPRIPGQLTPEQIQGMGQQGFQDYANKLRAAGYSEFSVGEQLEMNGLTTDQSYAVRYNTGPLPETPVNPYTNPSATPGQAAAWNATQSPEQAFQYAQLDESKRLQAENQTRIDGLQALNNNYATRNQTSYLKDQATYDWQNGNENAYAARSQGFADQRSGQANEAGRRDDAALASYQSAMSGYTNQNNQLFNNLQGSYDSMSTPLQSTTRWDGDLTSQAAQSYADPSSIAAQNQGMSWLGNSAQGGLNVNYSALDPQAFANVNSAMGSLQGGVNGGWDVNYQGLDPAAYQAQAQATQNLLNYQNIDYSSLSPQAQAAQNQTLGILQSYGMGNMDVSLRDADPAAYDNQQRAMREAQGVFYGDQDIKRDAEALGAQREGLADYKGVFGGSGDVAIGELDPEAYAAQKSALKQFGDLTTTRMTDAERFVYERERIGAEQTERANREANMSSLRQRGMGGSGMELVNNAIGSQQTSQNRLLANLGANATAVNRSMQALQGYGALSTDMVNSANQLAGQNQDRRLQGLNGYAGLASTMQDDALTVAQANQATRMQGLNLNQGIGGQILSLGQNVQQGNMERRMQGLQGTAALSSNMVNSAADVAKANAANRIQSYSNAGALANQSLGQQAQVATANMNRRYDSANSLGNMANQSLGQQSQVATANMNRQLSAQQSYTDAASQQRSQSFNEAFSRGTAADQTAQFNRQGALDVSMFNDKFNQSERDASWGRSTDLFGSGLSKNNANAAMDTSVLNATNQATDNYWNRQGVALAGQDTASGRLLQAQTGASDRALDLTNRDRQDNSEYLKLLTGNVGMSMENSGAASNSSNQVLQSLGGIAATDEANHQAARSAAMAPKQGFLGLWTYYPDDPDKGSQPTKVSATW